MQKKKKKKKKKKRKSLAYRMVGNFQGVQFSRKGNLQKFRGLIFADGRSRTAPSTVPG